MSRTVLIPCGCGKVHKLADPGQNAKLTCKRSGSPLVYECFGDDFALRGSKKDYALADEALTVGRESACDIRIPDGGLSRQHCRIIKNGDAFAVEDLGSRNGTYLNDEAIEPSKPAPLRGGDLLRMGRVWFRFVEPAPPAASDAAEVDEDGFPPAPQPSEIAKTAQPRMAPSSDSVDLDEIFNDLPVPPEDEDDKFVGRNLGPYKVERILAQGGMGRVYVGLEAKTGQPVIIKTILPENATDMNQLDRFLREIDVCARMEPHPNIASFLGTGQHGEILYFTTEFFDGKDLSHWCKRRRLSVKAAWTVGLQILKGLEVAHTAGIIHRDLKPSNILMSDKAQIKIIDFGISKVKSDPAYSTLTIGNARLGTPRYMAPEQLIAPEKVDGRTDLYAVGGIMYYCLTSRTHRPSCDLSQLVKVMREEPTDICKLREDIPDSLAAVIHKALAPEIEHRYASATEMREALEGAL